MTLSAVVSTLGESPDISIELIFVRKGYQEIPDSYRHPNHYQLQIASANPDKLLYFSDNREEEVLRSLVTIPEVRKVQAQISLSVNGQAIQSGTSRIDDALEGNTFNCKRVWEHISKPILVNIQSSPNQVEKALSSFANNFNSLT
jgi:flagellar capping protein FliD